MSSRPSRGAWPRWAPLACAALACDSGSEAPKLAFDLPASAEWATHEALPPKPIGDLVLITNNFEDTVSYVDLGLDPPAEIARMPVGFNPVEREGPHHVAVSGPDTFWIGISNFVPGSGSGPHGAHGTGTADGYAMAIRISDGATLGAVRVDQNPGDIRVTPDLTRILVTHFDLLKITTATPTTPPDELNSRLAIIDAAKMERETMVTTCPASHGVVISPDSARATIACWDDDIAIVDLASADHPVKIVQAVPIAGTLANPECQPYALTQSPDGGTIWVGCFASGELRAYDTAKGEMDETRHLDLGGAALFGAYLDDHSLVVASQTPDRVTWVDTDTAEATHVLELDPDDCLLPHVVKPARDGKTLLLVCEGDRTNPGTFVVIDAATREVLHVVPVGRFPDDIGIVPKVTP